MIDYFYGTNAACGHSDHPIIGKHNSNSSYQHGEGLCRKVGSGSEPEEEGPEKVTLLKCKMCGGNMAITDNRNIAMCEFCGTKQTVPDVDNDKKLILFNRANHFRMENEFDKAAGLYETIIADFPNEAEAYWGLVLCKYGIEYVNDPKTGRKVPTCHRSSFASVLDDFDYRSVIKNAGADAAMQYKSEAEQIDVIRAQIIKISNHAEPYDIFICYKETDAYENRTLDSVMAEELYNALTNSGYRTFFSRISLEDKLGIEFEPYIFSALNSSKIMFVVGTTYENFTAPWVKNEWGRFLKLIESGEQKYLIPCFKNMDINALPKEFIKLQAQDLNKIGAIQDIIRGVGKLLRIEGRGTKHNITEEKESDVGNLEQLKNEILQVQSDLKERKNHIQARIDGFCADKEKDSKALADLKLLIDAKNIRYEGIVNHISEYRKKNKKWLFIPGLFFAIPAFMLGVNARTEAKPLIVVCLAFYLLGMSLGALACFLRALFSNEHKRDKKAMKESERFFAVELPEMMAQTHKLALQIGEIEDQEKQCRNDLANVDAKINENEQKLHDVEERLKRQLPKSRMMLSDIVEQATDNVKRIKMKRLNALSEERNRMTSELARLKGLFTKKRRLELEAEIADIDRRIKNIDG